MKKRYFVLTMDDLATPGFCSWTKDFYGTLDEITEYIRRIPEGSYETTKAALQEYLNGNTDVKHHICFHDRQLLTPVEVIKQERFELEQYLWDHKNIFDCIYKMKADMAVIEQMLIKSGDCYTRCVRCAFTDLQYMTEAPLHLGYRKMHDGFWGLPGMMHIEGNQYILSLYVLEKRYQNLEEALADMGKVEKLDLTDVCNEIFGDG